ncbi:DUF4381 domain-containing protein [Chitinophaga barathri]|uniref:DUF4381 domain-containing protein n=1 Tax=Chitinophaga barathri TaxID=1647451 RepID=A0A3N4MUB0_9BACT|nr:DUF4381 domain-containing protein [Chitinophaga barathri]RPD39013.1 DUF4381 domain-containing protein [Chitinophaga barathri]
MIQDAGQLIEPPPVQFSPVTPGWYVSGALLVILLAVLAVLLIHRYLRNRYRRQALQQLETIAAGPQGLYEVNMLMKRIAMRNYGRDAVAALRGDEWVDFLNSVWKEAAFTPEEGKALSDELYRESSAAVPAAFLDKSKRWIKGHRR